MYKATYRMSGDRGESLGSELVGYFDSEEAARRALRGTCPWDFNSMWAGGNYKEFQFEEVPGKLTPADIKFIKQTDENLIKARAHALEWVGSGGHQRAPQDW